MMSDDEARSEWIVRWGSDGGMRRENGKIPKLTKLQTIIKVII